MCIKKWICFSLLMLLTAWGGCSGGNYGNLCQKYSECSAKRCTSIDAVCTAYKETLYNECATDFDGIERIALSTGEEICREFTKAVYPYKDCISKMESCDEFEKAYSPLVQWANGLWLMKGCSGDIVKCATECKAVEKFINDNGKVLADKCVAKVK